MRVERARAAANIAIPVDVIPASVPPASTATASPCRIQFAAWPIASAPEAQALTTAMFGPRAPRSIETMPGAMSTSAIAAANGDTRRGPSASRMRVVFSITSRPPMPDAIRTPTSVELAAISRPESTHRLARGGHGEMHVRRSPASLLGPEDRGRVEALDLAGDAYREARGVEVRDRGDATAAGRSDSQLSGARLPTGETAPMPVTTTRRGAESAMVPQAYRTPRSRARRLSILAATDAFEPAPDLRVETILDARAPSAVVAHPPGLRVDAARDPRHLGLESTRAHGRDAHRADDVAFEAIVGRDHDIRALATLRRPGTPRAR